MTINQEEFIRFHDPTIVEGQDGYFYCFSTDTNLVGVQIARSLDLLSWELHKPAFNSRPIEVDRHVKTKGFWAPEIIKVGDEYRLYCCSSHFGTSQSVIGLASSKSLSEDFVYQGDVLRTYHTGLYDAPNAIDANVVTDELGQQYLVYGSFFGGIYIAPLDETGFMNDIGYGTRIAGGNHTAVEGGYMYYDKSRKLYFLFVSYGSLRYDYHIRVGVSETVTGPFLDSKGQDLINLDPVLRVGDKIIGSYDFDLDGMDAWMAPGHNSILCLKDGPYLVHHVRKPGQKKESYMQIRKLYFSMQNQMFTSPVYLDEQGVTETIEDIIHHKFRVIHFDSYNDGMVYGRDLFLDIERINENVISFKAFGEVYEGRLLTHKADLYLTAISPTGVCIWALAVDS